MSDATETGSGEGFAFCGACGARIEASARFCTSCGEVQEQFVAMVGEDDAEARTAVLPTPSDDDADLAAVASPRAPEPTLIDLTTDEDLVGETGPPAGLPLKDLPPPVPAPPPASPPVAPPPAAPSVPTAPKQDSVTGLVVLGYACAIVLPLVGAVVGGALHRQNRHGIRIVVLSLSLMALFVALAVALLVVLGVEVAGTSTY